MRPPFESKFEALNFLDVRSLLRGYFFVCGELCLFCCRIILQRCGMRDYKRAFFVRKVEEKGKVIGNSEK